MDTITQALLGAAIGQAFYGKKLGRKAAGWGAIGGIIPDLDTIPAHMAGPLGDWLYHRGPTHALWFGPLLAPVIGYGLWKRYKRKADDADEAEDKVRLEPGTFRDWTGLFFLTIFTHPLLDIFTSYGTQLFTPFLNTRVAIHGISIVDPIYSFVLIFALIIGKVYSKRLKVGTIAAIVALVFTTGYLFYGLMLNGQAVERVENQLKADGEVYSQVNSYPTLLQIYQRRIVVRVGDEVHLANISMWKEPGPVKWARHKVPDHPFIAKVFNTREGEIFKWFALNETVPYIIEENDEIIVVLEDLRYGIDTSKVRGLWGLEARFDKQGNMIGRPEPFSRHIEGDKIDNIVKIFKDTF